jgi:hypothetical protein
MRTSEKIAIAELRLRSNISLKVAELRLRKCFLQVAEVLPSSCGIAITDSKKKLRMPTSAELALSL